MRLRYFIFLLLVFAGRTCLHFNNLASVMYTGFMSMLICSDSGVGDSGVAGQGLFTPFVVGLFPDQRCRPDVPILRGAVRGVSVARWAESCGSFGSSDCGPPVRLELDCVLPVFV